MLLFIRVLSLTAAVFVVVVAVVAVCTSWVPVISRDLTLCSLRLSMIVTFVVLALGAVQVVVDVIALHVVVSFAIIVVVGVGSRIRK